MVKGNDENGVYEVDKCVSDIATIVQVQRQVKEVKSALVVPVDALEEHIFGVLVGDVADHNGCARVFSPQNSIQIHSEMGIRQLVVRLSHHR